MTDIDAVHECLAADPADYQSYFVLADLYDEDGKPELAEGFRALGFARQTPGVMDLHTGGSGGSAWAGVWYAWTCAVNRRHPTCRLPVDWYQPVKALNQLPQWRPEFYALWRTRRQADMVAAQAFGKLPEDRRKELTGPLYGVSSPEDNRL